MNKLENKKIIIYPASFWPHKNHKYIIDSAILLKKKNINECLFATGGKDKIENNLNISIINITSAKTIP